MPLAAPYFLLTECTPDPPPSFPRCRYLEQCGEGFEGRLTGVIERLAGAAAPDPSRMIAEAAAMSSSSQGGAERRTLERPTQGTSAADAARKRVQAARVQEGGTERALVEFVKDLASSFLADSFGIKSFAEVLKVFLRTGFTPAAR